jgi:hypothetical protein
MPHLLNLYNVIETERISRRPADCQGCCCGQQKLGRVAWIAAARGLTRLQKKAETSKVSTFPLRDYRNEKNRSVLFQQQHLARFGNPACLDLIKIHARRPVSGIPGYLVVTRGLVPIDERGDFAPERV